jgi:hypothetical protein
MSKRPGVTSDRCKERGWEFGRGFLARKVFLCEIVSMEYGTGSGRVEGRTVTRRRHFAKVRHQRYLNPSAIG